MITRNVDLKETFKKRLTVSEQAYKSLHEGAELSVSKKNIIARCLANTSTFLTEQYAPTSGTQMSNVGPYKKFALDITTVAMPNLIAHDLVLVKPLPSFTGVVFYYKFVAGVEKGGVEVGRTLNDPWALGAMDEARINYTSPVIVDSFEGDGSTKEFTLTWKHNLIKTEGDKPYKPVVTVAGVEQKAEDITFDAETGKVTLASAPAEGAAVKVAYQYDMVTVPQEEIPTIKVVSDSISLTAKPRRVKIFFSQFASFMAKQEAGFNLEDALKSQAVSELEYEIDSEIVGLLAKNAGSYAKKHPGETPIKFNKRVPVGISKSEHYEAFAETLLALGKTIRDRTKRYGINYIVGATDLPLVVSLMKNWKDSGQSQKPGPYFAGTINGIKVYVHPEMEQGTFFGGYHGDDLMTSSAVYGPYMPIVPTALLQGPDGGSTQGFSTLYALEMLNDILLVEGKIVDEANPDANQVVSTKAVNA